MALPKPARSLRIPITGGNVSFYNETLGEGIYPTPVLGVVGFSKTYTKPRRCISLPLAARSCYCRGGEAADITDVESEFGSSEYAKENSVRTVGYPPELDLEKESCAAEGGRRIDSAELGGFRA